MDLLALLDSRSEVVLARSSAEVDIHRILPCADKNRIDWLGKQVAVLREVFELDRRGHYHHPQRVDPDAFFRTYLLTLLLPLFKPNVHYSREQAKQQVRIDPALVDLVQNED